MNPTTIIAVKVTDLLEPEKRTAFADEIQSEVDVTLANDGICQIQMSAEDGVLVAHVARFMPTMDALGNRSLAPATTEKWTRTVDRNSPPKPTLL